MANERKLIPVLGNQLQALVNGFILRLLILLYYVGIIGGLIGTIIFSTSKHIPVSQYDHTPPYKTYAIMRAVGFTIGWAVGYWIAIYFLTNLLIWLFKGSAPKMK